MTVKARLALKPGLRRHKNRGFTLTEIAIVLGIIGLILGAIWVAASAVYTNMRVGSATRELLQITQAVRAMYTTSSTVDGNADMAFSITQSGSGMTYIQANIFPNDTLTAAGTGALDPWQGAISIQSQESTTPGDSFSVLFDNVPQGACIALITENTGTARDTRMLGVSVGKAGTAPIAGGVDSNVSGSTFSQANNGFPVTPSAAQGACADQNDSIAFSFGLK